MERPKLEKKAEVIKRERYEEFVFGFRPISAEAFKRGAVPAIPAIPRVRPAIPAIPPVYRRYIVPANIPVEVEYMPSIEVPSPKPTEPVIENIGKATAITGGGLFLLWLLSPLIP